MLFADNIGVLQTPAVYAYDRIWLQPLTQHFSFSVRACHSVHIAFSTAVFDQRPIAYEVVLGDMENEHSAIRDYRIGVIEAVGLRTPGILHCYMNRR